MTEHVTQHKSFLNSMTILGLLLAIGMASAAFILGVQAKRAVSGQQSITVKGLAEKPIKADNAEWSISIGGYGDTQAAALKAMTAEKVVLDAFLTKQGLTSETWTEDVEGINPHFVEEFVKEQPRQVQRGFDAAQTILVSTKDLVKITQANKAVLQLKVENHNISAQPPNYLVSDLETVKMSLIAAATKNARTRATEFVKQDGVKVGVMKSANQGAFYILPVGRNNDDTDNSYGGVNDKSTIDKTARVVVTIVYNIE